MKLHADDVIAPLLVLVSFVLTVGIVATALDSCRNAPTPAPLTA